jgi:GNAT superfamily N-acetyltransferase
MKNIKLATSIAEIEQCYPILSQLRTNIPQSQFVEQVQQYQQDGYNLAYLDTEHIIQAVAGFHIGQSFGWGNYLYVDDLVTHQSSRSKGHGRSLFQWLVDYAKAKSCQQIHLDSRVIHYGAHKFYLNQGMSIAGYHFVMDLQ